MANNTKLPAAQLARLEEMLQDDDLRDKVDALELHEFILHEASGWFNTRSYDAATKKELDAALDIFAQDGTGGMIGLWNGAGREGAERPVVVLGSEGEYGVLAGSLDHFIDLTAAGQPWNYLMRGKVGAEVDPALVRALEAAEDTFGGPFRAWLAQHTDVYPGDENATSWRAKK